ncbi:MAG: DUF4156 domain-containing protein [Pseudomonadota bacterium]
MSRSLIIVLLATLSSCTWVKLDEAGVNVALMTPAQVTGCERLGTTQASSAARVGALTRNDEKVAMETLTLAKNTAAAMGGDTVVEQGPYKDGKQTFIVYRCNQGVN